MKALIAGMGFGQALYGKLYIMSGHTVDYIDPVNPEARYKDASEVNEQYDIAHVCTPNHTHWSVADMIAHHARIVIVEKPGVKDESEWLELLKRHPNTRIMMAKNNQYRKGLETFGYIIRGQQGVNDIYINWNNNDRVPNPGSWFTNSWLAYGGVSRDLLPHLLSIYLMLNTHFMENDFEVVKKEQRWTLADLTASDYGEVDPNGTYDVDDTISLKYSQFRFNWHINTAWRTLEGNDIGIHAGDLYYELGLCPENAYESMIMRAVSEVDNDNYWSKQRGMDTWIHRQLEML